MTKKSNWHIWCRAVVKNQEGPLLHFCICWSGLSCNSLHSNNCQIFAKILLKISFEYFQNLYLHFVFFCTWRWVHPPVQQLMFLQKKFSSIRLFFKMVSLMMIWEEEEKVQIIFRWGDVIYECFVKPKCTNKEKIRIFRQICFAHIIE